MIPSWLRRQLDALPEDERRVILDDMDRIASWHGLATPTIIETADE